MNIKFAKLSNIGGRKNNDDTVEIIPGKNAIRAYVGDGLGSYAGGKQASQTAGDALITYRGSMLSDDALLNAARQAQEAVCNLQKETDGNMKTTIVFLDIEKDRARWMHVGDSRLYHFVDGKLAFQTTDHSVSQMAVMMGEITTHEIRFHVDRNRVLRSLGGENAKAELSQLTDLSEGHHAFLLCSDGFWEYVYEDEMEATLQQASDPQEWLDSMEKILRDRIPSNNDNYTAAVVFAEAGEAAFVPLAQRAAKADKPAGKSKKGFLFLGLGIAVAAAAMLLLRPVVTAQAPEETMVTVEDVEVTVDTVATEAETTVPATTAPVETTAAETVPEETVQEETTAPVDPAAEEPQETEAADAQPAESEPAAESEPEAPSAEQ